MLPYVPAHVCVELVENRFAYNAISTVNLESWTETLTQWGWLVVDWNESRFAGQHVGRLQ